jgi:hypothetical protein
MKPKEKAIELVEKINNELNWIEIDYQIDLYRDVKQCALIAVDEILEITSESYDIDHINWWQEVKTEIEKL